MNFPHIINATVIKCNHPYLIEQSLHKDKASVYKCIVFWCVLRRFFLKSISWKKFNLCTWNSNITVGAILSCFDNTCWKSIRKEPNFLDKTIYFCQKTFLAATKFLHKDTNESAIILSNSNSWKFWTKKTSAKQIKKNRTGFQNCISKYYLFRSSSWQLAPFI